MAETDLERWLRGWATSPATRAARERKAHTVRELFVLRTQPAALRASVFCGLFGGSEDDLTELLSFRGDWRRYALSVLNWVEDGGLTDPARDPLPVGKIADDEAELVVRIVGLALGLEGSLVSAFECRLEEIARQSLRTLEADSDRPEEATR